MFLFKDVINFYPVLSRIAPHLLVAYFSSEVG